MIVYMAMHKVSFKKYIGQTVQTLAKRKSAHLRNAKNGHKSAFYNAIRKYRAEAFEWTILYHAKSIEELNAMEEYYIAAYETRAPKGYNIMFGGGNRRQPLPVRKKMSKAMKGRKCKPFTEEHKKNISAGQKGKTVYAFHHSDHGIFTGTQSALWMNYGLNSGHLSKLISGKLKSHKGWRMAT